MAARVEVLGVPGLPEVKAGDDLADLIAAAIRRAGLSLEPADVVVVTHKVVSKAEGRLVRLDRVTPSNTARQLAEELGRRPEDVEVILRETARLVRAAPWALIAQTRHGFVCANAGVDHSNTAPGVVSLLPEDPDASARGLQAALEAAFGVPLAVVVSDTFGRPWRLGQTNVAVGVAGMAPLNDYRGQADPAGRTLVATQVAVADEVAAAAELVMGKLDRVPVAIVRGVRYARAAGSARDLVRPAERDLFR